MENLPGARPIPSRRSDRRLLFLVVCLSALPWWLAARDRGARPDGASALSLVKQAMGGERWDALRTLHAQGRVQIDELQGSYDLWMDMRRQSSYEDFRFSHPILGDVRTTTGWNGSVAWAADQTGDVCVAASAVGRRRAAGDTYRESFAYFLKNAPPASVQLQSDAGFNGQRFHVLLITPPDASPFEVWTDKATNRIARVIPRAGVDRILTNYADLRLLDGLILPFHVEDREARSANSTTTRSFDSIEINRDPPAHLFDPPPAVLEGLQFPPGTDSVSVPFRFEDGHIYLPVSINGRRLENFIFDTGMSNTVDVRRAKSLGLKVIHAGASYGGGTNAAPDGLTRIARVEIGDLKMDNQIMDVTPLPAGNPGFDGGVGYELAKRSVVSIDYGSERMTFTKPGAFRPPASAIRLPLRFASISEILVDGTVEGVSGEFQLDTGDDGSLTLNRPFAERTGMLDKYHSGRKMAVGGVGGKAGTVLFQPADFTLGGLKPSVSIAGIMLSKTGSGADEYLAGTVGNEILRQYRLTLDYAHEEIYLEKDPNYGTTYTINRPRKRGHGGGLGFTQLRRLADGSIQILDLTVDGAASRAHIEKGDFIVAINGSPLVDLTVPKIFEPMVARTGTVVTLTIRHGGVTHDVKLTTE